MKRQKNNLDIIPIFFAADDNYAPFLSVAIESMLDNASKDYYYNIHILNSGINEEYKKMLNSYESDNCSILYVDVNERIKKVGNVLHTRDYYSSTIYYRLFIADLFPEYDKALYLDVDILVLGDISKLYNHDINGNYLGAVTCDVVNSVDVFIRYSEDSLGVEATNYFNSGILLMNLAKLRDDGIFKKFTDLLPSIKFFVAPDQDYLNVLCKDKVVYLDQKWNQTPAFMKKDDEDPYLVHFKLTAKPWHYDNVRYGDLFWKYTKKTGFYNVIKNVHDNYSDESKKKDELTEKGLVELAIKETNKPDTYKKLFLE